MHGLSYWRQGNIVKEISHQAGALHGRQATNCAASAHSNLGTALISLFYMTGIVKRDWINIFQRDIMHLSPPTLLKKNWI
jgi:hypothetical protein